MSETVIVKVEKESYIKWIDIPLNDTEDDVVDISSIVISEQSESFLTGERIHILRNLQCKATNKNLKRLLKQGYTHMHDKHFIPSEYNWILIEADDEFCYSKDKATSKEIVWDKKTKSWIEKEF